MLLARSQKARQSGSKLFFSHHSTEAQENKHQTRKPARRIQKMAASLLSSF
jgi:hypothetical protein